VVHHGATPPSYHLAVMLDHTNWTRGLPHALAWQQTHHSPASLYQYR
jgi:hypothetical protein